MILIFADKSKYFYRHSGTIMDAVACGVVPVVPNLPILASQVLEPAQIGVIYESVTTIPEAIEMVVSSLRMTIKNQQRYKDERSRVYIEV
jgi:hypothetical protein